MTNLDFAAWAPAEIKRLRDEANALEAALQTYLAARLPGPSQLAGNLNLNGPPTADTAGIGRPRPPKQGRKFRRGSKVGRLMNLIAESGADGITRADIYTHGGTKTPTPEKNHIIRGQLWNMRKAGAIIERGDRVYAAQFAPTENQGADPQGPAPEQ